MTNAETPKSEPSDADLTRQLLRHAQTGATQKNPDALEAILALPDLEALALSIQRALDEAETHAGARKPWRSIDALVQLTEELFELHLLQLAALILGRARRYEKPTAAYAEDSVKIADVAFSALADLDNATAVLALHWDEVDVAEVALAQASSFARRAKSPAVQAAVALNQAHLALRLRHTTEAWKRAEESLRAARRAGAAHSELRACIALAQLPAENPLRQRQRWDYAERAVELARDLRSPPLTSSANNALGLLQAAKGDHHAAHTSFRRALSAAKRTGNPDRQAVTLQNLAAVCSDLERFGTATRYLRQAVDKALAVPGEARVDELMESLARNQNLMGDREAAVATCAALLDRLNPDSPTLDYARALALHGALLADAGQVAQAVDALSRARDLLVDLAPGDPETDRATTNLAFAHLRAGTTAAVIDQMPNWLAALPTSQRGPAAMKLALMTAEDPRSPESAIIPLLDAALSGRSVADRIVEALTIAAQMSFSGRPALAIDVLRKVYDPRRRSQRDKELTLSVRNDLALSLIRRGHPKDVSEAQRLLEANLRSADRRDDRITAHLARVNLTEIYRRQDDPRSALTHARRALELSSGLGDRELMFVDALQIARVHTDLGHPGNAKRALDRARKYAATRADEADLAESSARNALLDDRPTDAATMYQEAIRKAPLDTPLPETFEMLAGLLEAYAASGHRRGFTRNLQRLITLAQELPHDDLRVVSFVRLAYAWSAQGRPVFAGQVLGLAILIAAVHASEDRPDELLKVDSDGNQLEYMTPLFAAAGAAAAVLRDEQDAPQMRGAIIDELEKHTDTDLAQTFIDLVDQALEPDDE